MYEIGYNNKCTKSDILEGEIYLHYLETGQYTYLAGEINALYHEAAVKTGISDSVQNILYVLCEKDGQCLQSEISKLTGISRIGKRGNRIFKTRKRQKHNSLPD